MKACVKESVNQVFNPPTIDDPHYIAFNPYVNELHDPTKREIYEAKVNKYLNAYYNKFTNLISLLFITSTTFIDLINYCALQDEEENKPLGLSWVQPGSLQPFSKPEAR